MIVWVPNNAGRSQSVKKKRIRSVSSKCCLPLLHGPYLTSPSVRLEIAFDSRPRRSAVANDALHLCATHVVNGLADGPGNGRGDGSAAAYGKRKGANQYLASVRTVNLLRGDAVLSLIDNYIR